MNQIFYPLTQVHRTSSRQINKVVYYGNALPKIKPKSNDLKQSIFDWLRQLNQEQLEEVLSFTSYFRVYSYLKMFKIDQIGLHEYQELLCSPFEVDVEQELTNFYSIQICKRLNKIDLNAHKYILDHIYVSDYEWLFDTITLKGDVEEIIKSFETISNGTIFTNWGELESHEEEGYFEINLKKQKIYQTLSELLVEEFQIAILLKYRQSFEGNNYTYQKNLLSMAHVRFNYLSINLQQDFIDFQQLFTQETNQKQLITELNLIHSWNKQIQMNSSQHQNLSQEVQYYFNQPKELFSVPLKQVLNGYVLFCKFIISKNLLKEFPLTQVIEIKRIKIKQDKQTQQQLQQLFNLFKNQSKSKILPSNDQRLFSTNNEEIENNLYELTSQFMKKLMDETFIELENQKKYKKQKQKKAKNQKKQYMSECISNCTEYQQQQQQQEIQFGDEEWINDTQTKNQKKKQRRKENQDKKKLKKLPEIQQVESSESAQTQQLEPSINIEIQKQEEIQEQVQETFLCTTTSTHDDDGEFIEVTKKKFNGKKKKQNNKKDKEQKEEQIQKQPVLLKKSNSSQQNYLSDDYKMGNTTPTKVLSQKKEQESPPLQKPGLVKSASKEQKTYKYDLDKGILENIYQNILEHKISRDIQSMYQKEQDNLLKFRQAREIAILRVQHIIKAHFFQFQVEPVIFGSSRTGLALHDSDVDMVVFGLPVFTKAQLFDPMRKLLEVFSQMKWAISYKHIFQATIPLIKITIDPSVGFLEFVGNPLYYIMNHRNIEQMNLKYGELSQNIQIDITFELQQPYPMYGFQGYHVGLLSTDYQLQVGNSIKGFTEVAIVLKKILKQRGLNDSYTGGVSSFCLTIMLAAIGENLTLGDKLLQFLQRYGWNFDPELQYISLHSQEPFMPIQDQGDRLPLNIISPINEEKIQIYVSKIQEILQVFKELYLELKENINQIATSLQKKLDQKELLQLHQTNIEKLVDLIQWQNQNLLDSQF